MVPSIPTSLLNPASRAAPVMIGAASSTPASAQVPVQTKAKASSARRYADHSRGGVVRGPTTTCGGRGRPRSEATRTGHRASQLAGRP